ncbi:hypothetical protein CRE_06039 [Caenorhabditis remanei]|uniref:Transposase Tc5 C-terminal domain-containing protein n=1 Tax=Caenorhabditis remanei TaxID=31234 RepID=E3N6I0_CAERE|nr:hypothetical protein CRE_06039 [Caenorhabditis remanei]
MINLKPSKDPQKILDLVEKLRRDVETIVANNPGIEIWNCDQTGLVKECHGMRTHSRTGSKKVKVKVQSKNATSHSITFLPIIGSDGFQHDKVFIQLGEPNGRLPQKGCYSDNTIHVSVAKSHIMSRATAEHFFQNVLFGGKVPATLLLILDSWPIFRDHAFIKSFAPPSTDLHIINIPPGGTSICQPADLSYNHQLKGIQKRLTSLVMFRDIRYRVSERDNLLKFASQAHWVIGSPRFKSFIAYGFYKGGFIHSKPPPFDGPKQFIFGAGISKPCSCSQEGFTVCPRCEESFCFECFWDKCHRC